MDNKNILIPNHRKISETEISEVLQKHSLKDTTKLPKIKISDPALADMDVKKGDVVEVTRTSFAGTNNKYYRMVTE